jgi:hypothetical protein
MCLCGVPLNADDSAFQIACNRDFEVWLWRYQDEILTRCEVIDEHEDTGHNHCNITALQAALGHQG